MKLKILIAEPRDILRAGIHTILAADGRAEVIYEASNTEELKEHISSNTLDLAIVNQILVSDITLLPTGRFVLFVSEFDITTFLMAYKHRAKGYLLETSQAELFRNILSLPPGAFLIEPTLTMSIIEYLTSDSRLMIDDKLLTPREREIVGFLREGVDRPTIAQNLNISGATLKTHIKNIFRKRIDIPM